MSGLVVTGDVAESLDLDFAALSALPGQVEDIGTLIAGREGGAVPLGSVLAAAGVGERATHLTLTSTDGKFSAGVPLEGVRDAVIAYRLGDAPLPAQYGGPLRFLIPDAARCGLAEVDTCANVKFLGSIDVSEFRAGDDDPS